MSESMNSDLLVSVSSGASSSMMAAKINAGDLKRYSDIVYVFGNTGQEDERSLEFMQEVNDYFNLNTIWVEAVFHHGVRKGTTHRVVTFETAHRGWGLFEEMAKKYGIPNKAYPHCTRELKMAPIHDYLTSILGWKKYDVALGYRIDEPLRLPLSYFGRTVDARVDTTIDLFTGESASPDAPKRLVKEPYTRVFPLADWLIDKIDVNNYWESMPFKLGLPTHKGNCKVCWKKSDNKLRRIIHENRHYFDGARYIEENYGLSGSNVDGTKRKFFRGHRSVGDIFNEYNLIARSGELYFPEEDEDADSGCGASCEAFGIGMEL